MRNLMLSRAAATAAPPAPERERDPRAPIGIIGMVRVGDERLPARLSDLSQQGFGATSVRPLPIGSPITISLPVVGEVRAQVRWALGGMFGARFLDPLDVGTLVTRPAPAEAAGAGKG